MKLIKIEIYFVEIPFKMKFSHSLKSRSAAQNLVVKLHSEDNFGIGESLPREYVTHENIVTDFKIIEHKIIPYFKNKKYSDFNSVIDDIKLFLDNNLNANEHSAFCAFETALINLIAKEFNIKIKDIFDYLEVSIIHNKKIYYSAVIGTVSNFKFILKLFHAKIIGFRDIKLKITPDTKKLKYILTNLILKGKNFRVDANESLSKNNYVKTIDILKKYNFKILEQPLITDSSISNYLYSYAKQNNIKVLLDESFISKTDLVKFSSKMEADVADLRISKNGGIINSLLLYQRLRENQIDIILGCMVGETILSKFNIILAKYLETVANEGLYDNFLFSKKNQIITNVTFGKNAVLTNLSTDIDFSDDFNINFEKFVKKRKIITF